MLTIGLTGGVGSGKSMVANFFSELGVPIIDSDILAREVVEPNTLGYNNIVKHFGKTILSADGTIDRKTLKNIVFQNPQERRWLEQTLHPLIRELTKKRIEKISAPYCIIVIPLLAETWPHPLINRVLVVDTTPDLQYKRIIERDHCTPEFAQDMINAQATRDQRLAYADDIIENNTDLQTLKTQVFDLHQIYLALASS